MCIFDLHGPGKGKGKTASETITGIWGGGLHYPWGDLAQKEPTEGPISSRLEVLQVVVTYHKPEGLPAAQSLQAAEESNQSRSSERRNTKHASDTLSLEILIISQENMKAQQSSPICSILKGLIGYGAGGCEVIEFGKVSSHLQI